MEWAKIDLGLDDKKKLAMISTKSMAKLYYLLIITYLQDQSFLLFTLLVYLIYQIQRFFKVAKHSF